MDKREMKKWILLDALERYDRSQREGEGLGFGAREKLAKIMDRNPDQVTTAMIARFQDLLRKMVENAESKLD